MSSIIISWTFLPQVIAAMTLLAQGSFYLASPWGPGGPEIRGPSSSPKWEGWETETILVEMLENRIDFKKLHVAAAGCSNFFSLAAGAAKRGKPSRPPKGDSLKGEALGVHFKIRAASELWKGSFAWIFWDAAACRVIFPPARSAELLRTAGDDVGTQLAWATHALTKTEHK